MLAKFVWKYLLAIVFGVGVTDGYGTMFGTADDKWDGEVLACNGEAIPQDQPLCAHRSLPCGTEITVVNRAKGVATQCIVADRGPYGLNDDGNWRGIIDLTPGAAKRAHLLGRDPVRLLYFYPSADDPMFRKTYWLRPKKVVRMRPHPNKAVASETPPTRNHTPDPAG